MPTILEQQQASFKDLLQFPAQVDFRIIVDALVEDVIAKLRSALTDICGRQEYPVLGEPRVSSNGRYVSYTLRANVQSAEMLNKVYKELGSLPCVKHLL